MTTIKLIRVLLPGCLLIAGCSPTPVQPVLTGWGGGRADEVVPAAARVGFGRLVLHHDNAENFARAIEVGRRHGVEVYAWLFLGDLPAWRKAFPDAEPPLQQMTPEEDAALARIRADTSFGKSRYQFGGEPVQPVEVLTTPLLCIHDPRVMVAFKAQVDRMLAFDGVAGVALDYVGYRNYRCCICPQSQRALADYRREHPHLSAEEALQRFSRDTLVAFYNELADYARNKKPGIRVMAHIYPVYLPEPLYGNRLDLDECAQTAAWYFEPFWSRQKIADYTRTIVRDANRYHRRPVGAAFIGYSDSSKNVVKSSRRVEMELRTMLEAGATHVHVCSTGSVLRRPEVAEVFRRYFAGPSGAADSAAQGTVP